MRPEVPSGTRTYLIASSLWIKPVDLRALRRIANSLQNGCLPRIRSSDNEHSELNVWKSGSMLMCSHSTKGLYEERLAKVMIRRWIPLGLYVIIMRKHQLTTVRTRRYASRIDPAYQCWTRLQRCPQGVVWGADRYELQKNTIDTARI